MDQHGVNTMGMQGGMSMPMSMAMPSGANGSNNPQTIGMGMNSAQYGVPLQQQQQQQQQQHMMMNMNAMNGMNQMNMGSMPMKMNPNAMNQTSAAGNMQTPAAPNAPGADWRIQLTREHRANLIAKIYNEMVRVSADPVPGIKLWMNVSWYELTLYKESLTQEEYINKIFTRLKSLRAQQTDMNAVMAAQTLPNQGMLSRLDFSYYNSLNLNQRAGGPGTNGGQVGGYPGHPQFGGPSGHPGAQQAQPGKPMPMASGEYWRQHAALKTKYHDDVEKVHNAFKKYVDHMKGHDETEQKKKLRYLLSYVQLCASILNEDKSTHPPRKIDELDKVYKYIVKIVNPYLKKLRTETDKRSFTPPNTGGPSAPSTANPAASSGAPNSASVVATSANAPGGFNGAMNMQQQGMDSSGLLQMPSNLTSSASSSSFMGFSNDLSPTNFSSMDLLDMDGSGLSGLTYDGHDGNNSSGASGRNSNGGGGNNVSGGDSSDLGFLEAL
ncbi:hypothetical protein PHYBOEH_008641 [Phytophthora boehmeriae]|uniref:Mediator complex subunit 15 KIX domain-containing protein n=1 Tax=Phytophthora boehmeriae TaxID=109152 RepID=A0A8T1X1D7_9STRA|nr:hypothetical protein PHYBOEH_008641 [Phytophthora boehmeriae]